MYVEKRLIFPSPLDSCGRPLGTDGPLTVDGSISVITHSFRGVWRKEIAFFVKVFSIQFSPISPVSLSSELLHQVTDECISLS